MSAPRGWEQLAQLGPLTDRLDARCEICEQPALVKILEKWRCAEHPPLEGEWGYRLNWAPRTSGSCAPNRCYCGRCPEQSITRRRDEGTDDELLAKRAARLQRDDLRIAL